MPHLERNHFFYKGCRVSVEKNRDMLAELQAEELELEQLRMVVDPGLWPRIYAMLKRVREEMRKAEDPQRNSENEDADSKKSKAA